MRIREELSSSEIGGTKVKTWVCDDPGKGDNPKLRKGRPLERLCPGVVGKLKAGKIRCDCECHQL